MAKGLGRRSAKDLISQKAIQEIKRLEAFNEDLRQRNAALRRSRAVIVQNNEAKLAAERRMQEVEEWHSNRANRAEERLNAAYVEYEADRQRLAREAADLQEQLANAVRELPRADAEVVTPSSESILRQVMTNPGACTEELRSAILSVEALVNEARRELDRKEFRDRRAAFEDLAGAMEEAGEDGLQKAIQAAKEAQVDLEDVEKAQAKLNELRMLSPEERAAKIARREEHEVKKSGFMLVKQNNARALTTLLDGLDDGFKWEDWRDHQGRSLGEFAKFLGHLNIQQALLQHCSKCREEDDNASELEKELSTGMENEAQETAACPTPEAKVQNEQLSAEEEEDLKKQAFSAVVQEKNETLEEIVKRVDHKIWTRWLNRGGKDLLTLAEERNKTDPHTILMKAIPGMVKKKTYPSLEENQAVWIFRAGDVQAVRATVLEDTASDAEKVFIEYWDGDEDPHYVDRCIVSV